MVYDIAHVKFTHLSFSWNNGIYAVIEKTETELRLCKIDENYKLSLYDDGRPMICVVGVNNKEVYPTDFKIYHVN